MGRSWRGGKVRGMLGGFEGGLLGFFFYLHRGGMVGWSCGWIEVVSIEVWDGMCLCTGRSSLDGRFACEDQWRR